MASSTAIHTMVWRDDGTLEETHGGITHDHGLDDEPQLLYARHGDMLIPLTYNHNEIMGGTLGIRELCVEEEVDTPTGYEIEIFIGSKPLGLEVLSAKEGRLTIDKPMETTFLYAISTDKSLSCEYKGERWYWLYSGGKVIMRTDLAGQLPTEFKFEPVKAE